MNERDLRSILDEEALRLVLDLGDEVEVEPENVAVSVEAAEEEELAAEDDDDLDVESEELSAEEVVSDTPAGEDADATLGESDDEDLLEINEEQLASMIRSILNEDDGEPSYDPSSGPKQKEEEGLGDADEGLEMSDEQDLDEDDDSVRMDPAGAGAEGGESGGFPGEPDEGARMHESDLTDDTVVEISESMLRDELSRMRRLRESSAPATTTESNDDEGTSNEVAQLKAQLQEYQRAVSSLRSQLDESNLFNAKLLYANKLLQGRDLSDRQRVNIVESLDSAKSLREVRLLYKSLTESVDTNRGNLTESKRRRAAGSASRPTRTGSVSKTSESYPENDRWALLAGLNK